MPNDVVRYPRYRFPPAIISHAVWLYYRFTLSFRDVEDLLAQRGITVSYESIRHWCETFGAAYARRLRRRAGPVGDTWHLDELFVTIRGQRQYIWRAVDQDGEVIDILLQPRGVATPPRGSFASYSSGAAVSRTASSLIASGATAPRIGSSCRLSSTTLPATPITGSKSHTSQRAGASATCGTSNRWHTPSDSSPSTASSTTCSPLDDSGFTPAIIDSCARARSLHGTPWQRPDASKAATTPNVRRGRRQLDSAATHRSIQTLTTC